MTKRVVAQNGSTTTVATSSDLPVTGLKESVPSAATTVATSVTNAVSNATSGATSAINGAATSDIKNLATTVDELVAGLS